MARQGSHVVERERAILECCDGRRVLHVGCADHPFAMEHHRTRTLLHEKIAAVATRTVGIDSSEEGVNALRSFGYTDVLVGDVERLQTLQLPCRFDVVVAGEILEHLANPGLFLDAVRDVMQVDGVLIVTVPNAFALKGILRVGVIGSELVHPGHVSYFSATTLRQLAARYGFSATRISFYVSPARHLIRRLVRLPLHLLIRYVRPELADGIVVFLRKCGSEKGVAPSLGLGS